jgi:hypothetical protein
MIWAGNNPEQNTAYNISESIVKDDFFAKIKIYLYYNFIPIPIRLYKL